MRHRKWDWESEYIRKDINEDGALATIQLWPYTDSDNCVFVEFSVSADIDSVEIDYEPEGPATYVPYGAQSVIYDDGSARINSIDTSNAVNFEEYTIYTKNDPKDPDFKKLSLEEAAEYLQCDLEDLHYYIMEDANDIVSEVESYLERFAEEQFYEDEEPDYDDWRDID